MLFGLQCHIAGVGAPLAVVAAFVASVAKLGAGVVAGVAGLTAVVPGVAGPALDYVLWWQAPCSWLIGSYDVVPLRWLVLPICWLT